MTSEQLARLEAAYFSLIALPAEQRESALSAIGAGDAELRVELESLLRRGPAPSGFMNAPVLGFSIPSPADDPRPDEMIGARVGPFQVTSLAGVGGVGAVYLAERVDGGFEQAVAIKVVKRGMDTAEVLARFRRERQTLANLRHPHIAALYDGGSLPDGRPYLVMELVRGKPIDRFCIQRGLGIAQKLRLFAAVCRAVQFAHQNLVIHRDLKPGNILVTEDGAPKLLDFGIAKLLSSDSEGAMTSAGESLLTPEYASPEQIHGRPITTASDVYSLGVMLYELLSGRRPYEFVTRTSDEIRRVVTTTRVLPPSAAAKRTRRANAQARLVSPQTDNERGPAKELRGDLDNIVLKAMRQEPERRYLSPEHLAADLERYLRGFPVSARPDTLGYRVGKFVRRNAVVCGLVVLVLGTATAGGVGVLVNWREAQRQRDQAFAARDQADAVAKFLQDAIASADPTAEQREVTVRDLLDRAAASVGAEWKDKPLLEARLRSTIGVAYLNLGEYARAREQLEQALQRRREQLGSPHADVAASMLELATVLFAQRDFAVSESLLRNAVAIYQEPRAGDNPALAKALNSLGAVLRAQGKLEEASATLRSAADMQRAAQARSLTFAESLNNYAAVLRDQRRLAEAETALTEAFAIRRELLGDEHPLVAQTQANVAVVVHASGDLVRADTLYRRAIALEERLLGPDHPERAVTLSSFGALLRSQGDLSEAEAALSSAHRIRKRALPGDDFRLLNTQLALAETCSDAGMVERARLLIEDALKAVSDGRASVQSRKLVFARAAALYANWGDAACAEAYRAETAAIR